jgi:hypothetical protein
MATAVTSGEGGSQLESISLEAAGSLVHDRFSGEALGPIFNSSASHFVIRKTSFRDGIWRKQCGVWRHRNYFFGFGPLVCPYLEDECQLSLWGARSVDARSADGAPPNSCRTLNSPLRWQAWTCLASRLIPGGRSTERGICGSGSRVKIAWTRGLDGVTRVCIKYTLRSQYYRGN